MPSARARVALLTLPALIVLGLGLTACSKSDEDPSNLPDGSALVTDSANVMKSVNSTHILIEVDGAIGTLPIKRAEGDLKRDGDAKGNIQLVQLGTLIQLDFVFLGDDVYLKFPTGGWQKSSGGSALIPYDPSAILDPDRGVAKLLATATDAKTEGSESVNGRDAYRVAVTFDNTAASTLVPGVPAGVTGQVWLDKETKHLLKAVVRAPASGGNPEATITVHLTAIDTPVTVSAP